MSHHILLKCATNNNKKKTSWFSSSLRIVSIYRLNRFGIHSNGDSVTGIGSVHFHSVETGSEDRKWVEISLDMKMNENSLSR